LLSCLDGFGIATCHVVDERLSERLRLALGIHMLDVPELVPVGLGVRSDGSNAIDREQGDVALPLHRTGGRVGASAVGLPDLGDDSTCGI
jgi:hypothetical protein